MLGPRSLLPVLTIVCLVAGPACERRRGEGGAQGAQTGGAAAGAVTGDDPTAHVPSGEPVVVVARVVDLTPPPPCNAQQAFAVAARYETVRVERGEFGERTFLVRTVCPDQPREVGDAGPVTVGEVHRLHLDPTPYRTQRKVQWIPVRTDAASQ